jgi:2-polyprenyl-3-methyl-5-hydroxy-6-metoxy-1,4-benzoquinol methylase
MDFARAMAARAAMTAEPVATLLALPNDRPWKVLDVAASHGLFGIGLMQRHPTMTVVALDWPDVLQVAEANARTAGVAERFATIAGDALAVDLGRGYDLVLLMNFLHHFDVATCEGLLRRVHAALAPGGRAVTLDFIPDEDRVSPPTAALFNLTMLATTPAGEAHTFGDFARMFRNAGFARSELHPLPPTPQRVVVSFA